MEKHFFCREEILEGKGLTLSWDKADVQPASYLDLSNKAVKCPLTPSCAQTMATFYQNFVSKIPRDFN